MKEILPASFVVLVLVLIHLFSNKLRFLHVIPRSKWLSVAGGASLSYVFVILLPELSDFQHAIDEKGFLGFIRHHIYFFALIGLAIFYSLERIAKVSKSDQKHLFPIVGKDKIFWIHISSFSVYNAFIGYVLLQSDTGDRDFYLFALAMALHFISNDYGLLVRHSKDYLEKGRWMAALSVVLGFVTGLLYKIPEIGLGLIFSFIAGGIILNVLKEELPEERESNAGAFWVGVLGYSLLILFRS